ncbi:MAG TPA: alpha-amylase family glycosyl hydrolase, partial [Polyangiaceae bacterium]|nr:alpha-amylase family glycosyl hydrolase [Polyangiaceae bacterium]
MNTKLGLIVALGWAMAACGTGSDAPPMQDGATTNAGASGSANPSGGGAGTDAAGGSNGGSAGSTSSSAGAAGAAPLISGPPPAGGVFVHLFEWKWTDIAEECETYLGAAGFAAVQVSPPSEHAVIAASKYPWWQRYQTVSYSLAQSRSGTEAEFRDMVARCARVGVGIYVDAVINHMTGQLSGTGSNGTTYTKYNYPGTYSIDNFHQPPCAIQDSDYVSDADHVRMCELSGLA